jgi:hypothetical protein
MPKTGKTSRLPYNTVIKSIKRAANRVKITFPETEDGRLVSAIKERDYLRRLVKNLKRINKKITTAILPNRSWCDIIVSGIPINLKMTMGGTDNIFNLRAVSSTVFGKSARTLTDTSIVPRSRDRMNEYHYLVVNKKTGKTILKSILDLGEYKSSSHNILQINWSKEFANSSVASKNTVRINHIQKKQELLQTVQKSFQRRIIALQKYAKLDINAIFRE